MQNDIASIKENKMLSESRHTCTEVKKNCAELYKSGKTSSGVYTIDLDGHGAFSVFCDQTAAGGGVDSVSEETGWLGWLLSRLYRLQKWLW